MPIPHGNILILGAASAGVIAINPRYRNGSSLVEKAWEDSCGRNVHQPPRVIGDTLFGFSGRVRGARALISQEPKHHFIAATAYSNAVMTRWRIAVDVLDAVKGFRSVTGYTDVPLLRRASCACSPARSRSRSS